MCVSVTTVAMNSQSSLKILSIPCSLLVQKQELLSWHAYASIVLLVYTLPSVYGLTNRFGGCTVSDIHNVVVIQFSRLWVKDLGVNRIISHFNTTYCNRSDNCHTFLMPKICSVDEDETFRERKVSVTGSVGSCIPKFWKCLCSITARDKCKQNAKCRTRER